MPNYNITVNSKFDPYSFEDYLKPLAILQEQHNQAADVYATALANSAGLQDILQQNIANGIAEDQAGYDIVKEYNDSINALAEDLAKNGLNRNNRRGVYETKAKTGMIERIKKAMDNRNTFIAQQNELVNKDPSIVLSDDAAKHGIMRFMNPDFSYRSYSENALRAQAAKLYENLAKSAYMDPNNPEYEHIAGLTMQMGTKMGLTPEQIQGAIDDVRNGETTSEISRVLQNIANGILNTNLGEEYDTVWNVDQRKAALSSVIQEGWNAIGTTKYDIFNVAEPAAAKRKAAAEKQYINSLWRWQQAVNAPGGIEVKNGSLGHQRKIFTAFDKYLKENPTGNGKTAKENGLDFSFGIGNAIDNFKDELKLEGSEFFNKETGEFTHKGKQIITELEQLNHNSSSDNHYRYSDDLKRVVSKLADRYNKGAILSESNLMLVSDETTKNNVLSNLIALSNADTKHMKILKGMDENGNFVFGEDDDFEDNMLDDKDKYKLKDRNTQYRVHTDASGRKVVTALNNSGILYAFDITDDINTNSEDIADNFKEYDIKQSVYLHKKNELESDPAYIEAINTLPNNRTNAQRKIIADTELEIAKYRNIANNSGTSAFNLMFDLLTVDQQGTKTTDTKTRRPYYEEVEGESYY